MNEFNFAYERLPIAGLLVALALIAISGCASVHELDVGRAIDLQAVEPAAVGDDPVRLRCPVRHIYVCERQLPGQPGTCYCAPEPAAVTPSPEGLRRAF